MSEEAGVKFVLLCYLATSSIRGIRVIPSRYEERNFMYADGVL